MDLHPSSEPATLVVLRRVRRGSEVPFEAWLRGVIAETSKFEGHLGATVLRPAPGGTEYLLHLRWATAADLDRWRTSDVCRDWLARVAPMTESVDARELHGLEAWFDLPGPRTPPRWKMALVTWMAITPLILGLGVGLGPLLDALPLPVRVAITSGILVPTMTWIVMPRLTRSLAGWLLADPAPAPPRS